MPTAKLESVPLDHPINTKVTSEFVTLTPTIAETYLSRNSGNRPLKPIAIANYARDMRAGKWETTGEAIQFDWDGRMIDGQNRCQAVIESGATISVLVVRGLAPVAQQSIDQGAKRTGGDALAFAGFTGNRALVAAAARLATARENGYLRTSTAMTYPAMTHAETVTWVTENPEMFSAAALAGRVRSGIGATPSVLAYCIWELERIDGFAAIEFFTSMAEMRTNGPKDPRLTLLRTFNSLREKGRTPTPALQISYIFRAWNAWREARSLTTLPSSTSDAINGGTKGVIIPDPV